MGLIIMIMLVRYANIGHGPGYNQFLAEEEKLGMFASSVPTAEAFLLIQFFSVAPYNDAIASMANKVFDAEIKARVESFGLSVFGIKISTKQLWTWALVIFTLGQKEVMGVVGKMTTSV